MALLGFERDPDTGEPVGLLHLVVDEGRPTRPAACGLGPTYLPGRGYCGWFTVGLLTGRPACGRCLVGPDHPGADWEWVHADPAHVAYVERMMRQIRWIAPYGCTPAWVAMASHALPPWSERVYEVLVQRRDAPDLLHALEASYLLGGVEASAELFRRIENEKA